MPSIALSDESFAYMKIFDANKIIHKHGIYPSSYNIRAGPAETALLLFPTWAPKTELTINLICEKLKLEDVRHAI